MIHVQCTCTKQTSLGSRSNVFRMLYERIWGSFEHVPDVEWTRSVSRSNTFGLWFKRVRLLVHGLSFERVSNASRLSIEHVWTKRRYTLCLTGVSLIHAILNSFVKDSWGFRFVLYMRQFFVMLTSWDHAVSPLSGMKKHPFVGGCLTTSSIVNSIGAIASVRYKEIVRRREGPLWEVPLYSGYITLHLHPRAWCQYLH